MLLQLMLAVECKMESIILYPPHLYIIYNCMRASRLYMFSQVSITVYKVKKNEVLDSLSLSHSLFFYLISSKIVKINFNFRSLLSEVKIFY